MKPKYKLQHPDLIQPKDKNDRLYQLLDQFLIDGDNKIIVSKLKVSEASVSNVRNGKTASKRIWDQFMVILQRRMKEKEKLIKYAERLLPQKNY